MSVRYVARKCTQCAGKLEYIKEKKTWKCLYCGAEIERTEQYDGLFTIKNVVRQALLDVAYRRLDSAQKNLVECEKIDSRYVGTIIAKIAYQMIMIITPGAYPQAELRNAYAQLKRNYDALLAIDKNIMPDEEALYESFDSADVYATLLLVYDSLNDAVRRDFMAGLINAAEVYAKEPNKNLLSYALKNGKLGLIDELMANPDNVDPGFALGELLSKYPDAEGKARNIERLLKGQVFKEEDKKTLDTYLESSADSVPTKGKLAAMAYAAGIKASLEGIIAHVLQKADGETADSLLRQVCASRLNDENVYKIIDFAISAENSQAMLSALDILKETNQYVLMQSKHIIALLSRGDLPADDKSAALDRLMGFTVDAKTRDAVINNYLCFNRDDAETRLTIIPQLLGKVDTIQTATIETYILKVAADGENKPKITGMIFDLDLNMSFFHDLLTRYMNSGGDSPEVKESIVSILAGKGIKIDPKAFGEYICNSGAPAEDKVAFVKKMLSNGVQLRGDLVNTYLEGITPQRFDSQLFALIVASAGGISEAALSNYLLRCKDRETYKVRNFISLASHCHRNVADVRCDADFAGQRIGGSLLTVYMLTTPDSIEVTKEIADFMVGRKAKLNADVEIPGSKGMKLKKFASAFAGQLGPVAEQILAMYKLN